MQFKAAQCVGKCALDDLMAVIRIGTIVSSVAITVSVEAAAQQGQSRITTLQEICGDCRVEKFTQCGSFLEGPTFDQEGNLWMVSVETGDLHRVSADGRCVTVANTGGSPNGLKFHRDGRLFGADNRHGIFTFDPKTGETSYYVEQYYGQDLQSPNDLVFDRDGGIYFTDPGNSSLLSPNGAVYHVSSEPEREITRVVNNLAFPNGIALSASQDTLYISETGTQRILAVTLASPGVARDGFTITTLNGGLGPDGLALDSDGNLYIAHFNAGEVVVLDTWGSTIGVIGLPPEAGRQTTNVVLHGGYLYITEAGQNEVWRVKVQKPSLRLFGDE